MKKNKDKMKIVGDLLPLVVDMKKLKVDPKNVIAHKPKNINVIVNSLKRYGQRKPIVVNRKTMVIEAGNGTYQAAKLLGADEIAAVFVEDDEKSAKKYSIMDNQSARISSWDIENLLDGIRFSDLDCESLGFSASEIAKLSKGFLGNLEKKFKGYVKEAEDGKEIFACCVPSEIVRLIEEAINIVNQNIDSVQKIGDTKSTADLRKFVSENNIPKRKLTEDEGFYLFIMLSLYHFLAKYEGGNNETKLYKFNLFGTIKQMEKVYSSFLNNLKVKKSIPRNAFMDVLLEKLNDRKLSKEE